MFEKDDHQHGGKQQTEKSKNQNQNDERGRKKEWWKCKEIQSKISRGRDARGRIRTRDENRETKHCTNCHFPVDRRMKNEE